MTNLTSSIQVNERDTSHWADWGDSELIDQAAGACQHPALIDDPIVREAIALNIIAPFRQRLAMRSKDHSIAVDDVLRQLAIRLTPNPCKSVDETLSIIRTAIGSQSIEGERAK